ncbi:GMC family oxidoreductase [Microvirga arabica]|uniref:GMC family oxidoreductase n=1 Tax=Microvirga arabica TaxID=1128671 RepID=UPI00193A08E3|nr:GMC family oxidoreductase [Microvirga arabica]MBM1170036.1 GMC family oxidoreductase [Microvirga arabica]
MASDLDADVVVVGSGVAGSLVAYELARAGLSVLILEAGPRLNRDVLVDRFRAAPEKHFMAPYPPHYWAPHPTPDDWGAYLIQAGPVAYNNQYIRAVGGTTWHWAAAAWRLLPSDFKLRTLYGVGRDWPFDYDFLEPYYGRAEREMGVAGQGRALDPPRSSAFPLPPIPLSTMDQYLVRKLSPAGLTTVTEPVARYTKPFRGRPPCCGNNNCMPICPIGAQYSGDLHVRLAEEAGARLIENAVANFIDVGPERRVRAIQYKDPLQATHTIRGRVFILACNGIETPKLMLISKSERTPAGVGNSSDMVGRNLMDHPGVGANMVIREPVYPGRGPQEITSVVSLRDGAFRRHYAARKYHFANRVDTLDITQNALDEGLLGSRLDNRIRDISIRRLRVDSFHEQLPDPSNRIVPSETLMDPIGIPRPVIRYSIDEYVRRSAEETRNDYKRIADILGATEITFDEDWVRNNHLVGTTIMGGDPRSSVVDHNCRSHDHPNLFIAGSSTFPSIASVNPTLTIAALSLLIADVVRASIRELE